MCVYCQEHKATEIHKTRGIFVKVCKDCAIINGYRSPDWYKDHKELLLNVYGLSDITGI